MGFPGRICIVIPYFQFSMTKDNFHENQKHLIQAKKLIQE